MEKIKKVKIQKQGLQFIIVKLKFLKEQEAKGLLSSIGIKTPLSQIPLFGFLF